MLDRQMPSPVVQARLYRMILWIIFALLPAPQGSLWAQEIPLLRGTVVFADGTPVRDATVTAVTICEKGEAGYRLVRQATATPEGTFSIPAFGEGCNQYRLTAGRLADFWIETGDCVFCGGPNGTPPTVDLSAGSVPEPVTIVLGQRGGMVDFWVWDAATARFIRAMLSIDHKAVEGKTFGSMEIATGKDGSADTLLLPPGEYVASVLQYQCGTKEYWAAVPPQFSFEVRAGSRQEQRISVDVRTLKSLKTYANPHGRKCQI
jgi:hypothetical protein